jgi:hypothetical protein
MMSMTSSKNSSRSNWRADTFTLQNNGSRVWKFVCQRRHRQRRVLRR